MMKKPARRSAREGGLTLVECMVSMTLGLGIVLAATALLLAAQKTYLAIDDDARIVETGTLALAAIGAAIRQAGYVDRSGAAVAPVAPTATLFGFDDTSLIGRDDAFDRRGADSVNGSDALVTRFMATLADGRADPDMLNCAGQPATGAASPATADAAYGWSIFYIARDDAGEPELFCKYRAANHTFSADAIARGIESMQFLYGLDLNGDGLPNTFMNASAVDALGAAGPARSGSWAKVVAVRIALSVRGDRNREAPTAARHLFGESYSARHEADDPGVKLDPDRFKPVERNRARRIFRSTVMLRNRIGDK
jgi:type IV pilus assembly protein PilW